MKNEMARTVLFKISKMMIEQLNLLDLAKQELIHSNVDKKHPFRYFVLASFGIYPEVRTVVKRKIDTDFNIIFFTDSRSKKVNDIRENNKVSALFYHPKKQLQIRVKGQARFVQKEEAEFLEYFNMVEQSPSKQDYTTLEAPATKLKEDETILYGDILYFLAIKIIPQEIEILLLDREGHQRILYTQNTEKDWMPQSLVP